METTVIFCDSFGSGSRGTEMKNLRIGDLVLLTESDNTTVGATVHGSSTKQAVKH